MRGAAKADKRHSWKVGMESRKAGGKTVSVVRVCLKEKGGDVWSAPPTVWFGCFPFPSQENC